MQIRDGHFYKSVHPLALLKFPFSLLDCLSFSELFLRKGRMLDHVLPMRVARFRVITQETPLLWRQYRKNHLQFQLLVAWILLDSVFLYVLFVWTFLTSASHTISSFSGWSVEKHNTDRYFLGYLSKFFPLSICDFYLGPCCRPLVDIINNHFSQPYADSKIPWWPRCVWDCWGRPFKCIYLMTHWFTNALQH